MTKAPIYAYRASRPVAAMLFPFVFAIVSTIFLCIAVGLFNYDGTGRETFFIFVIWLLLVAPSYYLTLIFTYRKQRIVLLPEGIIIKNIGSQHEFQQEGLTLLYSELASYRCIYSNKGCVGIELKIRGRKPILLSRTILPGKNNLRFNEIVEALQANAKSEIQFYNAVNNQTIAPGVPIAFEKTQLFVEPDQVWKAKRVYLTLYIIGILLLAVNAFLVIAGYFGITENVTNTFDLLIAKAFGVSELVVSYWLFRILTVRQLDVFVLSDRIKVRQLRNNIFQNYSEYEVRYLDMRKYMVSWSGTSTRKRIKITDKFNNDYYIREYWHTNGKYLLPVYFPEKYITETLRQYKKDHDISVKLEFWQEEYDT